MLPTLQTARPWGYAATFTIQVMSSASIIVPVPGLLVLMMMAQELDPLMLAGSGAAGAALGNLTGYWVGAQGREIARRFGGSTACSRRWTSAAS
jgi:membrane protein DedA with SNARE-associated domain